MLVRAIVVRDLERRLVRQCAGIEGDGAGAGNRSFELLVRGKDVGSSSGRMSAMATRVSSIIVDLIWFTRSLPLIYPDLHPSGIPEPSLTTHRIHV